MKTILWPLLAVVMLLSACSTPPANPALWNPRPSALRVDSEIRFSYKAVMGWWNSAPPGRYAFVAEDEDCIYFRLEGGLVAYGSRFDAEKKQEGGLALSKRSDAIHVYVEEDYDKAMKGAGELPKMFVKKPADGTFRVVFGVVPPAERTKIKMDYTNASQN